MTFRRLVVLSISLTAVGLVPALRASEPPAARDPRLVVVLVVDQMRADYLRRFEPYFESGGFRRLLEHGAFFVNAAVPYFPSETAPGHATIATGCWPRQHGIIANKWFTDPSVRKLRAAVDDPNVTVVGPPGPTRKGQSPHRLRGSTLGDQLKLADRRARVFAVSFKDRAAIFLGGRNPDGVFWCDKPSGLFVSSTYYTPALPEYAEQFNAAGGLQQYAGQKWEPLLPAAAYAGTHENDPAWSAYLTAHGATFPHILPTPTEQSGEAFSELVVGTPFGNDAVLGLAGRLLAAEHLGQGPVTDLLLLSLSANDYVGHRFGPDSAEMLDMTIRTDRQLAPFFDQLDQQVGLAHCLIVLTADHGVTSTAHLTQRSRLGGGFINESEVAAQLERVLAEVLGAETPAQPLVLGIELPWVHCAPAFEETDRRLDGRLTRAAAEFLRQVEGVERVFTAAELAGPALWPGDASYMLAWHSYFPGRAGQFLLALSPFWQPADGEDLATHAGGSRSDRHVPIVMAGPRIQVGEYFAPAELTDIAVTVSAIVGIEPPFNAVGRTLDEALTRAAH